MKVLVLTPMYPPTAGSFVMKQVKALRRKDGLTVDVVHITRRVPWPLSQLDRFRCPEDVGPVDEPCGAFYRHAQLLLPGLQGGGDFLWRLSSERLYRQWLRPLVEQLRPDIVHAHEPHSPAYFGLRIQEDLGIPMVMTTHGGGTRTCRSHPWFRERARRFFDSAARVIAVSDKLRRDAAQLGFRTDHWTVIGNGVEQWMLQPKETYFPGVGRRPLRLVLMTRLIPLKGTEETLRAIELVRRRGIEVVFDVMGPGPSRPKLEHMAKELGLGDVVTFHGFLPNADAVTKTGECDLFVMPSWDEGFGIVYVEAMARGVPVIACTGQGISPLIEASGGGTLVPTHDFGAIAEAIETYARHPDRLAVAGRCGHAYVTENYTWDHIADRMSKLYEQVAG